VSIVDRDIEVASTDRQDATKHDRAPLTCSTLSLSLAVTIVAVAHVNGVKTLVMCAMRPGAKAGSAVA
jgi:hypothetical protein